MVESDSTFVGVTRTLYSCKLSVSCSGGAGDWVLHRKTTGETGHFVEGLTEVSCWHGEKEDEFMQKWFYLIKGREIPQLGETSLLIKAEDEAAARLEVSSWHRVDSVQRVCVANDFSRSVDNFCNDVLDLKIKHNIYKELFEDTTAQELMEQTAQQFFRDIQKVLCNYLLLEFAKITDPSKSGNYDNFTVSNIIDSNVSILAKDVYDNLCQLNGTLNAFRKYIVPARHKLIAHNDKNTRMSGTTLGEFPKGEDDKFIGTLEDIARIMHKACFGDYLLGISSLVLGGVRDFKDTLRKAVAFQKALSESKGEELARLAKILHSLPF